SERNEFNRCGKLYAESRARPGDPRGRHGRHHEEARLGKIYETRWKGMMNSQMSKGQSAAAARPEGCWVDETGVNMDCGGRAKRRHRFQFTARPTEPVHLSQRIAAKAVSPLRSATAVH